MEVVESLVKWLSSPDMLAFPDFKAVLSGEQRFWLKTDMFVDGLGAAVEQEQPDGTARSLCYLTRSTFAY